MQSQGPAGGSIMFVEKYRPSRIEELISHQDILSTCETAACGAVSPLDAFAGLLFFSRVFSC